MSKPIHGKIVPNTRPPGPPHLQLATMRTDPDDMTAYHRYLVATVLTSLALVAIMLDNVNRGWTVLGGVGVGCFVLAIASSFAALRRTRLHGCTADRSGRATPPRPRSR
ncbi:MAG: hypothetical protein ACXWM8_08985 [Candidatus Limnocylindrales bacterium]